MSKCLYENVLITMRFEYADTDSVKVSSSVRECLRGKVRGKALLSDVDCDKLLEIFKSGETHAIPGSMQK